MALEDGYGSVIPGTPEVAKALLDIAEGMGLAPDVVRTTVGGFVVPVDVVKRYEESLGATPDETEKSDFPDKSWKNAEIKEWAESHEVDLGDATKKADMLAAIAATEKE